MSASNKERLRNSGFVLLGGNWIEVGGVKEEETKEEEQQEEKA